MPTRALLSSTCLNSLPNPSQSSATAALYRNRLLAYGSGSHVVVEDLRWRNETDRQGSARRRAIFATPNHVSGVVTALSFHPGVQSTSIYLASGDSVGRVTVWDVSTGCPIASIGPKDYGLAPSSSVPSGLLQTVAGTGGSSPSPIVSLSYVTASYLLAILLQGGTLVLYDVKRCQLVYLKQLGEEFTLMRTNQTDARQVILANEKTGVFTNMTIRSLKSEKQVTFKRFQIGDGKVQLYDVRWAGGKRFETIVLVLLEREMILFDVEYGTSLWSGGVRGGMSGLQRVAYMDAGGGMTRGMPARIVVRHVSGEVSVWQLNDSDPRATGYAMVGWWSTKDVGGVAYLEGLDGSHDENGKWTAFVGINMTGDALFQWDVRLDSKVEDEGGNGNVLAHLREMRQGLSGRVVAMDASSWGSGQIAAGTERGFVEVYASEGNGHHIGANNDARATSAVPMSSMELTKKLLVMDSIPLSGVAWLGKYGVCRKLVTFASQPEGAGQYRNVVKIVDVRSGRVDTIKNACEEGMIKEVKVSYAGAYMLLVCAGMPNELWWTGGEDRDADPTGSANSQSDTVQEHAQRLRQLELDFTSVSWIDSGRHGKDPSGIERAIAEGSGVIPPPEEMFAFSLADARLGILLVKGRKIQDTRPMGPSWAPLLTGEFQVTSCAPAQQYLFLGSSDGTLARWDTTTGATVAVETGCRRITKLSAYVLPQEDHAPDTAPSVLLALLSSSGTFAVLAVDAEGKFKTTKITWTSGVSSVGYASDVMFYSSDVLMVRMREGGVLMLNIKNRDDDTVRSGSTRHGVVIAPGVRRLVAAMIQGGLDIEATRLAPEKLDDRNLLEDTLHEDELWEFLPVDRGEPTSWDGHEYGADAKMATSPAHTTDHQYDDSVAEGHTIMSEVVAQSNPAMAELLRSRTTSNGDDVDSPLYSPTGQGAVDRAVFQSSMGMDPEVDLKAQSKSNKKKSVTSKVLKSISTLARDKSSSPRPESGAKSKDRRAALASSVLVPQSPAAMCSPRHALHSSRALIGMSLADAVRVVSHSEVSWNIDADFGASDSPARRMAIAARIQWNDEEYIFWKELHQHLYVNKNEEDPGSIVIDDAGDAENDVSKNPEKIIDPKGEDERGVAMRPSRPLYTTIQPPDAHIAALSGLSKWHANAVLEQREIVEKAVIELICLEDVHAAVSLLLTSPPEATPGSGTNTFYRDALCALGLAYSTLPDENSLFAQAARVIAINASTGLGDSLVSIPLLYATGKHAEVVETLQSNDLWLCAAALAASKLKSQPRELENGLLAFAEHVALRRGAVWDAVGILIGARLYNHAVQLLADLNMIAEAYGLVVTLLDASGEQPGATTAGHRENDVANRPFVSEEVAKLVMTSYRNYVAELVNAV